MVIIKRTGIEVPFDSEKIYNAIMKAIKEIEIIHPTANAEDIDRKITDALTKRYEDYDRTVTVEEVQEDVETELMKAGLYEVAKAYIRYRHTHKLNREENGLLHKIQALNDAVVKVDDKVVKNEEADQENSNKNPTIASTQRDYMAGEISKEISRTELLPHDIWEAHEQGIIHFHDADYFSMHIFNCSLPNLDDMLQNGTCITGTLIEKPHSFSTACNIMTQIIAQIASNQYGGQTMSLRDLAPFVDISRQKLRKEVAEELSLADKELYSRSTIEIDKLNKTIDDIAEARLRKEINRGCQIIQYQINTLLTTNGQAPFVTLFMALCEARNDQEKHDLAMIIEEMLKQRIQGVKNEKGVWVSPAFPKLVYVLDEDNMEPDSEYFYLTHLAAECSAKRLVPDYLSAKMERKLKKGDIYGPIDFLWPMQVIA